LSRVVFDFLLAFDFRGNENNFCLDDRVFDFSGVFDLDRDDCLLDRYFCATFDLHPNKRNFGLFFSVDDDFAKFEGETDFFVFRKIR
jgi:hypothetical protein